MFSKELFSPPYVFFPVDIEFMQMIMYKLKYLPMLHCRIAQAQSDCNDNICKHAFKSIQGFATFASLSSQ